MFMYRIMISINIMVIKILDDFFFKITLHVTSHNNTCNTLVLMKKKINKVGNICFYLSAGLNLLWRQATRN